MRILCIQLSHTSVGLHVLCAHVCLCLLVHTYVCCAYVHTYIFGHMLRIFIADTVPTFLSQIPFQTNKDDGFIWTIVAYFWVPFVPNILKGVAVGYIKTDKKDICLGIGEWAEPIIVLLTS